MARGAYSGDGYAGDYNREHVLNSSDTAAAVADMMSSYDTTFGDAARAALGVTNYNSARMLDNAERAFELSQISANTAMAHSAAEAAANRDWQERLSNTAHQREVQDLIAAGLNPVLSANQGAFTGAGAVGQGFSSAAQTAGVDTAGSAIVGTLFNSMINNAANKKLTAMNNAAQAFSAEKNLAASQAIAGGNIAAAKIAQEGALLRQEKELSYNEKQKQLDRESNEAIAKGYNTASRYATDSDYATKMYGYDVQKGLAQEHHYDTIPGTLSQGAKTLGTMLAGVVNDQYKFK